MNKKLLVGGILLLAIVFSIILFFQDPNNWPMGKINNISEASLEKVANDHGLYWFRMDFDQMLKALGDKNDSGLGVFSFMTKSEQYNSKDKLSYRVEYREFSDNSGPLRLLRDFASCVDLAKKNDAIDGDVIMKSDKKTNTYYIIVRGDVDPIKNKSLDFALDVLSGISARSTDYYYTAVYVKDNKCVAFSAKTKEDARIIEGMIEELGLPLHK